MIESIYYPIYKVKSSKYWLIKDEPQGEGYSLSEDNNSKSFLFHIDNDDYLSTLATILRFFEESIQDRNTSPDMRDLQLKIIRNIIGELIFLNKHYAIVPKEDDK